MSAPRDDTGHDPDDRPDFGPSGYLPERAAKRARKIVLRAPLGVQWIVGAVVAGALVVIAGVLFLQSGDAPPPDPWVAVAPIAELEAGRFHPELDALVVTAGGRARAFTGAVDVAYCAVSNRLESPDGGIWALTGRGLGGTPSLREHPTLVSGGVLYVDPTRTAPTSEPLEEPAEPGCR